MVSGLGSPTIEGKGKYLRKVAWDLISRDVAVHTYCDEPDKRSVRNYLSSLGFVINAQRDCMSRTCPPLPTALEASRGREAQLLKWRYLPIAQAWVCLSINWYHNPTDWIRGGINQSELCFLGLIFFFHCKEFKFSEFQDRSEYFRVSKSIDIYFFV